jgi:hypothetical protein
VLHLGWFPRQPINYSKTEAFWSARAIGPPKFEISAGDNKIQWK